MLFVRSNSGRVDRTSGQAGLPGPGRPAYRDRNVLRWLVAYTASAVGDTGYFLSLGWAATRIAGPSQVGLVLAVGAVPRALLMLGGGVVADRLGPRRVVIGSDTVRCLVVVTVAAWLALASPTLWLLIVVALVFGIVDALYTFVQAAAEPAFLGRIMSLLSLASFGFGPMLLPLYGAGVAVVGARPMVAVSAAVSLLGAAVAMCSPAIRQFVLPRASG